MDCQIDLLQMLFLQPKAVKIDKRFTCQNTKSVQKVTLTSVSQTKQFIKITGFKYFCTGLISLALVLCAWFISACNEWSAEYASNSPVGNNQQLIEKGGAYAHMEAQNNLL